MPLVDVELSISESPLPAEIDKLLLEARSRVDCFLRDHADRVNGFVPSNFELVAGSLQAIIAAGLATGNSFCEWGSGFGVAALLASQFGMSACGIEIDPLLVDASRQLAADFDLPVEFVQGSFVPRGGEACVEEQIADYNSEFYWLAIEADDAYDDLGLDPDDFDLVFAYPWPGEESAIDVLFQRYAADGALLLTFNQHDTMRLQRKVK